MNKLEGCKYSHIRRIVRAAVDNVVKILISDRGVLARNIQRLNIQYIQKLFNKVMYMKQAKDKKSKGEARTYIMAAMDGMIEALFAIPNPVSACNTYTNKSFSGYRHS